MVKPEKMIDDDYFQGFLDAIYLIRMTIKHSMTIESALYRVGQHLKAARQLNKDLKRAVK